MCFSQSFVVLATSEVGLPSGGLLLLQCCWFGLVRLSACSFVLISILIFSKLQSTSRAVCTLRLLAYSEVTTACIDFFPLVENCDTGDTQLSELISPSLSDQPWPFANYIIVPWLRLQAAQAYWLWPPVHKVHWANGLGHGNRVSPKVVRLVRFLAWPLAWTKTLTLVPFFPSESLRISPAFIAYQPYVVYVSN